MSAAGRRPTAGARFVFEKAESAADAVIYTGFVHLPDADLPATACVQLPGGAVKVTVEQAERPDLEKTAAALVRAATKGELLAGLSLPHKIVRWRG